MSKRMMKSKSLPWFRIFSKAFITETLGLNATETGIYIRLLAAMNEAGKPITGSALNILPRLLCVRQKTFCEAVEKLIERNLIDRLPEGLWAPLMDEERAFRDRNSDKARSNSVKRWRKTQQNQSGSDANHTHTHTHREPPNGGSRYEGSTEQSNEGWRTASADAGRSPTGDRDECPASEQNPHPADGQNDHFRERREHHGDNDQLRHALAAFKLIQQQADKLDLNRRKLSIMRAIAGKLAAGADLAEDEIEKIWMIYSHAFPDDEAGLHEAAFGSIPSIPF